jgi:hypothetical protein
MGEERVLEASGTLDGSVDVPEPVTWGALRLSPDKDGRPRFELRLDVSGLPDEGIGAVLGRVGPAVQAAVAAACGAWVDVTVSGWSYPHRELRRVGKAQGSSWAVRVNVDSGDGIAAGHGRDALHAVLGGPDRRLAELYEVYLLGVRAVHTTAPVVGMWAFATVLEEEALPKEHNLGHVPALAKRLRDRGYELPATPARGPDEVRSAALHPTPRSPLPTHDEVAYLRELARAYLLWRARQRRARPSQLPER